MAGPLRARHARGRLPPQPRYSADRVDHPQGYHAGIDSYSAFRENDRKTPTGLTGYLRERGFERVTICGLATDFCVFFSTIDARDAGFETTVALDASRGIDLDGSLARALTAMRDAGVELRP